MVLHNNAIVNNRNVAVRHQLFTITIPTITMPMTMPSYIRGWIKNELKAHACTAFYIAFVHFIMLFSTQVTTVHTAVKRIPMEYPGALEQFLSPFCTNLARMFIDRHHFRFPGGALVLDKEAVASEANRLGVWVVGRRFHHQGDRET